MNRCTKARAVPATSRQPLSMVMACSLRGGTEDSILRNENRQCW